MIDQHVMHPRYWRLHVPDEYRVMLVLESALNEGLADAYVGPDGQVVYELTEAGKQFIELPAHQQAS